MVLVAVPRNLCERVSQRAVQFAREDIQSRNWSDRSIQAISALPGEGRVGLQTSAKYLMHQNQGIRPFVMWWAEGRTIPLPDGNGGTHPVRATRVGQPGWVTLPGGVRKWREQRWRHPGLKPKNFLQDALERAMQEAHPELRKLMMGTLTGSGANV
jgi:hypothetical protein